MNSYINAEKLKAEIERRAKSIDTATGDFAEGRKVEQRATLSFIDSLQQEQPSLPSNLDEAATSFAQQRFPEDEQAYARRCARKGFKAGAEWMVEQKCPPVLAEFMEKASEIGKKYNYGFGPNLPQPKVDLEKEMKEYFGGDWKDGTPIEVQDDMIQFARHFVNLGLNARK